MRDESGQILRHVVTIGVAVAIVILLAVEVGPIIWLRISSINDAEEISNEAASQYFQNKNEDIARQMVADNEARYREEKARMRERLIGIKQEYDQAKARLRELRAELEFFLNAAPALVSI